MDTYEPRTQSWETHQVDHTRTVDGNQRRLLYKVRRSLTDILTDCPRLDEELRKQHVSEKSARKRELNEIIFLSSSSSQPSVKRMKASSPTPGSSQKPIAIHNDSELPVPAPSLSKAPTAKGTTSVWSSTGNKSEKQKTSSLDKPNAERAFLTEWTIKEIVDNFKHMKNDNADEKDIFPRLFGHPYKKLLSIWLYCSDRDEQ